MFHNQFFCLYERAINLERNFNQIWTWNCFLFLLCKWFYSHMLHRFSLYPITPFSFTLQCFPNLDFLGICIFQNLTPTTTSLKILIVYSDHLCILEKHRGCWPHPLFITIALEIRSPLKIFSFHIDFKGLYTCEKSWRQRHTTYNVKFLSF